MGVTALLTWLTRCSQMQALGLVVQDKHVKIITTPTGKLFTCRWRMREGAAGIRVALRLAGHARKLPHSHLFHKCYPICAAGQPQRQANTAAAAGEEHQQGEAPPAGNQGAGAGSITLPDELTRLLTTSAGSLLAFNGLVPVQLPPDAGEASG